jgi:hypothetical protein
MFTVRFIESQEVVATRKTETPNAARNAIADEFDVDFNLLEVVDADGLVVDSDGILSPEEQALLDRLPVV